MAGELAFPNGMLITPDDRRLVVAGRPTTVMLTADWRGTDAIENVIEARTGQVLVVEAPAPGVGWP